MKSKQKLVLLFCVVFSTLSFSQALQWAKQIGGTNDEIGNSIATDASGNVYTTGLFFGTADFNPGTGSFPLTSLGSNDIFISKLDALGNFVWAKSIGGTGGDNSLSIVIDVSGNIYTTGFFNGTVDFDPGVGTFTLASSGGADAFLLKLDALGNFVWAKSFGGTSSDGGNSVAVDATGVFAAGYFSATSDFNPDVATYTLTSAGSLDAFVLKLDAAGNFVWAKQLGGSNGDAVQGISLDVSGNVHTTGYFQGTGDFDPGIATATLTSAGSNDIFVSKLDPSGNFMWCKSMGGTGDDIGYSINADAFANVYTTGHFNLTSDFNPGIGTNTLIASGSNSDVFISRLDNMGNYIWAQKLGGTGSDWSYGIDVDATGNIYLMGQFDGTSDFDPGAGTFTITSAGNSDIFISKIDPAGNFAWAVSLGGTGQDLGKGIRVDVSNNVYSTGRFALTCDFDPGAGALNFSSFGFNDVFVHKMNQGSTSINKSQLNSEHLLYPNPAVNEINIKTELKLGDKGLIIVRDITGRKLYEGELSAETKVDVSNFANGTYIANIIVNGNLVKSRKFVVLK